MQRKGYPAGAGWGVPVRWTGLAQRPRGEAEALNCAANLWDSTPGMNCDSILIPMPGIRVEDCGM